MGQSSSSGNHWRGYDAQLLEDKVMQTISVEDPDRVKNDDGYYTSSNIIRNMANKGLSVSQFPGFMDDPNFTDSKENKDDSNENDEKNNIDFVGGRVPLKTKGKLCTGWQVWKSVATNKDYKDLPCFGTRPWVTEEKKDFDKDNRGEYTYETYENIFNQTVNLGLGLRYGLTKYNFTIENNANIGIFSVNRAEWMITHLGNWSQSFRTVALYDTLGFESVKYIVNHAEMPVIFVEKDKLGTLFKAIEESDKDEKNNKSLKLKFIVQFDYQKQYNNIHEKIDESDVNKATMLGLTLIGFSELTQGSLVASLTNNENNNDKNENAENNDNEKNEKKNDYSHKESEHAPAPKDLAFVMYTSGTTGDPKGVMLSHRAFACVVGSVARNLQQLPQLLSVPWIHVSYLPLAHSFETAVISSIISQHGKIAFYNGNIKKIGDDWREVKPTLVFGVPRIYNKTYDKVMQGIDAATGVKKSIASKAKAKSFKEIKKGRRSVIYDKLVWSGVAPKLGYENVKLIASGAAPLSPAVAEFLRVACKDAAVAQGYGMTETTAISFFTDLADLNLGHVGNPVDNVEYRLIDVPDKEYFVEPRSKEDKELLSKGEFYPRGEIQMRGPTMMDGYFKNEEATSDTIDKNSGWLSTGDIGRINPNGTLSIVDRAKAIFKLERGEYISPEKVEIAYGNCAAVAQIFVTGNSNLELPVALIVPDGTWLQKQFETKNGKTVPGFLDVKLDVDWTIEKDGKLTLASEEWVKRINENSLKNEEWIRAAIRSELNDMKSQFEKELRYEERIADFDVVCELDTLLQGFTIEKETLTPSMKLKRRIIEMKYKDKLEAMYGKMNEAKKKKQNDGKPKEEKKDNGNGKGKEEKESKNDDNDNAVTTEKVESGNDETNNNNNNESNETNETNEANETNKEEANENNDENNDNDKQDAGDNADDNAQSA